MVGDLGPFTSETWIKEAACLQLTPSHSFGAAPALRGQTVKRPRAVSSGPRAADGVAVEARSVGGPVSLPDGAFGGRVSPTGLPLVRPLREAAPAGQSTRTEGPGPGGIRSPVPAGALDPWPPRPAREPGSRLRPEKPGGGEERARRPPGPGDGPNPPRAGKEDPGAPPAGQRFLCRAKDFRSNGLGPERRNCTRSPHAATDGAARPPPARLPGPDLGPRPPPREREGGGPGEPVRGLSPSSVAGSRTQTCGRPGLPRRGPEREAPGLGITEGRGGRSPPGLRAQRRRSVSPLLLDLSGPDRPLQSLPRCC
ncbi:unnamed protein product [Rangifer tarandus platyrhynchus]|uniref:Uncharacterized protein n=2 Tax=Rangifer tarandus platyrhynchus TaxID=3082113 RepID=A0ABN8ZVF3_RANTA|nr:unnamed protein product [Rangifer tarandus platyrhynchus]